VKWQEEQPESQLENNDKDWNKWTIEATVRMAAEAERTKKNKKNWNQATGKEWMPTGVVE